MIRSVSLVEVLHLVKEMNHDERYGTRCEEGEQAEEGGVITAKILFEGPDLIELDENSVRRTWMFGGTRESSRLEA